MSKPTYPQIAHRAGVGTATVERVLNGRGGVRPATAEKVLMAARALDWPGRLPEMHRGLMRIEVILVRPETSFYARVAKAFRRIASTLDASVQVHVTFLPEDNPHQIAMRIRAHEPRRAGLIISSPDHPAIGLALTEVQAAGVPVVQMVSQTIKGADFVGIDNYAAGRMAGLMMARLGAVQGTVVALCHSQVYRVHRDRIAGFSDYLEDASREGLNFRRVLFGRDERDTSAARLNEARKSWPDLAGVYNAGGANTGVLDALRLMGQGVFFVGHELTDVTREALRDGVAHVIFDQLPEAQARRAIDIMLARLGLLDVAIDNPPIRFTTITPENL